MRDSLVGHEDSSIVIFLCRLASKESGHWETHPVNPFPSVSIWIGDTMGLLRRRGISVSYSSSFFSELLPWQWRPPRPAPQRPGSPILLLQPLLVAIAARHPAS